MNATSTSLQNVWEIAEAEYPFSGGTWEQLSFCLNYAVLAPSGHNSQPWRFKLNLGDVDLFADRTRALPTVDPHDRELILSCGAALYHLCLAIRFFGRAPEVTLFPSPADPDWLARVKLGSPRALEAHEQPAFHAMTRRRTYRHPFEDRPVPESLLAILQAEAAREGATLTFVQEPAEREEIARLVWHGDRAQMASTSFRRELAAWIHPARASTQDGVPGYALGMNELLDFATPAYAFAMRTFDLGKGVAAHDRHLVEGSPVLAVLSTEHDTPSAWLAAGQALARVLLVACAHGVFASYLNQPIEVEVLRPQLREALHLPGHPQILLRMGYAPEIKPTPRRAVREVLV